MIRVGASSISAGPLSLLALGLTVTLASLSWRYFERPILAWKDRRFERHLLPDPQDTAILQVTEMDESGVTPQPS
ncbi:MAG TPA: hypothetical protein VH139_08555, partial [Acidobacteriaceae bacterium]|jgi:peptidoglycan/LPS O-acetylase OafA/YrhL|nr:hypothetical protein [Acidobacteriaceae bacterium]